MITNTQYGQAGNAILLGSVSRLLRAFLLTATLWANAQTASTDKAIDKAAAELSESLMARWQVEIESLTSPALVAIFSKQTFDAAAVQSLYMQYRAALVKPPGPDDATYAIPNGEESLRRAGALAKKLHNVHQGMQEEAYARYGTLIAGMREVMFLDWKHIPYAMRQDRARDLFWWELHDTWSKNVEREYQRLFKNAAN
ncbi:MAG: hypothetical protein HN976_36750 [Lentisphaerae bacterium]|jgi:hypothetical protein|nr:hypothetical protein [Lentisphaerota bacterium]MBT7060701.1 hypothetical protein [Lentisphaerota bacterium]